MKLVEQTIQRAIELGACAKADASISSLEDCVKLLKSPQGREWVVKNDYPSLQQLRKFRSCNTEQLGVYIDAGKIDLVDPVGVIVLVGDTDAKIKYTKTERYTILAIRGAYAEVIAHGFCVLRIETDSVSNVTSKAYDHAIISKK